MNTIKLPLKDGQEFTDSQGRKQVVGGSIKKSFYSNEINPKVCWTIKGNWFRRNDGVEVTGAFLDENSEPVTISEAYRLRKY